MGRLRSAPDSAKLRDRPLPQQWSGGHRQTRAMPGLRRTGRRGLACLSPVRHAAGAGAGLRPGRTPAVSPPPPPRSQLVSEGCDQPGLFKRGGDPTSAETHSHCRERARSELLLLPPPPPDWKPLAWLALANRNASFGHLVTTDQSHTEVPPRARLREQARDSQCPAPTLRLPRPSSGAPRTLVSIPRAALGAFRVLREALREFVNRS